MRFTNHPEPIKLTNEEKRATVWACGACRRVALDKQRATECCAIRVCDCGAEIERRFFTTCDPCMTKKAARKEAERFSRASKIPAEDYAGPVYDSLSDEYHESIDDLLDWHESEGFNPPEYVYACIETRLTLDAADVVNDALQCHHEDAWDVVAGNIMKLQVVLDDWCSAQTLVSWSADFSRAVLLEAETPENSE